MFGKSVRFEQMRCATRQYALFLFEKRFRLTLFLWFDTVFPYFKLMRTEALYLLDTEKKKTPKGIDVFIEIRNCFEFYESCFYSHLLCCFSSFFASLYRRNALRLYENSPLFNAKRKSKFIKKWIKKHCIKKFKTVSKIKKHKMLLLT